MCDSGDEAMWFVAQRGIPLLFKSTVLLLLPNGHTVNSAEFSLDIKLVYTPERYFEKASCMCLIRWIKHLIANHAHAWAPYGGTWKLGWKVPSRLLCGFIGSYLFIYMPTFPRRFKDIYTSHASTAKSIMKIRNL